MSDFTRALQDQFGVDRVQVGALLAPLTTFKVGGPAEWLVQVSSAEELIRAFRLARDAGIAVTLLGGGSNVLVSDAGIPGLVVRTRGGRIARMDDDPGTGMARVRADAGVTVNQLVRWTITHGVGGLEAWAGTPGTVGGGIFGNAHYGGRLLGDLVATVGQ
jgi:UDP-N-acetylmuramate dehydrogenase